MCSFNLLFLFPTLFNLLYPIIDCLAQLYVCNHFFMGNLIVVECGFYNTNILHLGIFIFADVKFTDSYH